MCIQLLMFYGFPLCAGPTDAMGMVVILIFAAFLLSVLMGIWGSRLKYLYPIAVAITFVPSVFIYYNETALVHALWYLVVSSVGLVVGILLRALIGLICRLCRIGK